MKERPILFSAPMVRAILEGRKTMTRRVVKVPWVGRETCQPYEPHYIIDDGTLKNLDEYGYYIPVPCHYGQPDDRLWVRETFGICDFPGNDTSFGHRKIFYRADGETTYDIGKWKPSIFMPRKLSRITLEITNVRVERLNDISEEDAKREGVERLGISAAFDIPGTWRGAFADLWQSINGPGSWDANPWVWVVEFKKI